MTITASRPATDARTPSARPVAALVSGATVFAVTAVLDLVAPATLKNNEAHTFSDYLFISLLIPFVWSAGWIALELRRWHRGADGRAGSFGVAAVLAASAGFTVAAIASLASGDDRAIAPVYPISMLVSLVGFLVLAVAWFRAGRLPRWAGPVLALGWFFGGPVAVGHGLFLILTVICLAIARVVHRAA